MPTFEIDLNGGEVSWDEFLGFIKQAEEGGAEKVKISASIPRSRTVTQNAALHYGFKHIAQLCNEQGIERDILYSQISEKVDFPVSDNDVKEVCRGIALVMFGKRTTTAIPSDQCKDVWLVMQMAFSQRLGVDIGDFPSLESLRTQSQLNE